MVERTKAEGIEEFEGKVKEVSIEKSTIADEEVEQYHVSIEPINTDLLKKSKTGMFHEWIKIPSTATSNTVPEGSVLDRFIQELEILNSEVKKIETHTEVLNFLKNKTFLFKKKKLGKAYAGHEAKEYWIPVKSLD